METLSVVDDSLPLNRIFVRETKVSFEKRTPLAKEAFSVSINLSTRWRTVQKGVRLKEWNPKAYVYTPRGDIRAKQAENPLKLDVSRDFAKICVFIKIEVHENLKRDDT